MRGLVLFTAATLAACGGAPEPKPVEEKKPVVEAPAAPTIDRSKLPEPAALGEWTPPAVNSWDMPNGISVWHVEQSQAPLISIQLVFPNGAASEPASKAGLTALTVDLLDEGAGKLDALALGDALQRMATDYGAQAATDGVLMSMNLLADKLDPSLAILSDILRKPKLAEAEFKRRHAQRVAAALAGEADIGSAQTVTMRRALYGDGYGGWPAGGVQNTLKRITYKDVKSHYKAIIQPKGLTIVAVGAIDQATLKAALDKTLGDWKGEPTAKVAIKSGRPVTKAIYFVDFPGSTQSSVGFGRRIPGTDATDYFKAQVFNHALGGAFTSRYNMNLREEKGWTYGARSGFNRWRQAGMFTMGAKVKSDTTADTLTETIKELTAIRGDKPVVASEREEAVGSMLLGFPGRFERMSSVAGQLASLALEGHPVDWLEKWPANIKAVTLEQANEMAAAYADPKDYIIVIAGDRKALEPSLEKFEKLIISCDAQGTCKRK